MKSNSFKNIRVPFRHISGAILPALLLLPSLYGQAPSISSLSLPQSFIGTYFDSTGNIYSSQTGPVTASAVQTTNGGGNCISSNGFFGFVGPCSDAYVGKITPSGAIVFGTWLGGNTDDATTAIVSDATGNVYFTGTTGGGFPTTQGGAIATSTTATAFAAKLSPDGSRLLYATYLPDTATTPNAIGVDAQGNVYIAGTSKSGHGFALKLNGTGSTVVYNVTLGGSGKDGAFAMHVDGAGNQIIAGQTSSADFPVTANALQPQLKGAQNVFIARLDATGKIVYATYLGGSGVDSPSMLQTDGAGNLYLAGQTSSFDFPTTAGSFEPKAVVPLWNNSSPAGFVTRLTADGTSLTWSTFVMSTDHPTYTTVVPPHEGITLLSVTAAGEVYAAGLAEAGFPTTPSAPQVCYAGAGNDALVVHLNSKGALADATYVGYNAGFVTALGAQPDGAVLLAQGNLRTQLQFGVAGSASPACLSSSVLDSATFHTNLNIVPGELVSLTGFKIGPDTPSATAVQVLFDKQPAPVLYAQSRQINVQVPVELAGQKQTQIFVSYGQTTFGPITATVDNYGTGGVFRLNPGGSAVAAAVNQDGTINGPQNPAPRGSIVSIWGTGFGQISPPCGTGTVNPSAAVGLTAGLSMYIVDNVQPGTSPTRNPVLYAGAAPGLLCGIEQINFLVQPYLQPGLDYFHVQTLRNLPQGGQEVQEDFIPAGIWVK